MFNSRAWDLVDLSQAAKLYFSENKKKSQKLNIYQIMVKKLITLNKENIIIIIILLKIPCSSNFCKSRLITANLGRFITILFLKISF